MAHTPIYLDFQTAVTLANTYGQAKTKAPALQSFCLEMTNLPIRLMADVMGDGLYFRFFIRKEHAIREDALGKNVAEYVRPLDVEMVIAPAVMELLGITGDNSLADNSVIDENLQACYLMACEAANLVVSQNGLGEELAALPPDHGLMIAQEGEQLKCTLVSGASRPSLAILEQEGEEAPLKEEPQHDDAKVDLALALLQPQGDLPADIAQGIAVLEEAAREGNPRAQWELGLIYLQGDLVPQDAEKGALWVAKSAENGYELAQQVLNQMGGDEPEITETGTDLIALAENGDLAAQIKLGSAYLHGNDGVEKNTAEGILWLERAAESNNASLQQQLAMLCLELEEEEPAYHAKGLYWLQRAGENGLKEAERTFRFLTLADELKGNGTVAPDAGFEEIMAAINKLAEEGDSRAAALNE